MDSVAVVTGNDLMQNGRTHDPMDVMDEQIYKDSDTSSSTFAVATPSNLSVSGIPPIPIANVKERNFLVGKVEKPSSMSFDDFTRCLPEGILHLFVGTWNMQRCKVPENLNDFLLPVDEEFLQEIYVVGVQESSPDQANWEVKLQETLGTNHVLAHSASHGLLHIAIFVRRDLMWYCSDFENNKVSTRIVSRVKTKGAVAVCFRCFSSTFLFVCSHFCSGERKTLERIANYHQINEKLNLPPDYKGPITDTTERFDHVFWFGDLNFRISQPHQHMKSEVSDPSTYNISEAIKCDQLHRYMQKGKVFVGFVEPPICFLPTYKFDPMSDVYDTSHKLRVPSYTDRILCKCKKPESTENRKYTSVMSLRHSDHRPVYALYEVVINRGTYRPSILAGQYNREVYVAAARRRARAIKKSQSRVCAIV